MEFKIIKPEYKNTVFLLGLLIPVAINALFTYLPYKQGWQPEGGGLIAALICGLIIISQYQGSTRKQTVFGVALFIPLLLFLILFTSIYVSCLNGDCL